jgi:hypothetical protein
MGNTGAGMSTLANALVLGEKAIHENNDDDSLKLAPGFAPIIIDDIEMFKIGHGVVSQTETPGYCVLKGIDENKEEVYLIDCPGFNDSNRSKEYSNRTTVHNIIMHAKTVKFCMLFTADNFTSERGKGVV